MSVTAEMSDTISDMMTEIGRLAAVKRHHLAPYLVNGSKTLSEPQARGILANLRKCEDITPRDAPDRPAAAAEQLPPLSAFKGRVPAGFYATPSRTGNNDLDFWKVSVQAKGKWEGFSFARRVLGGGTWDQIRTEYLPNIQQRLALQAILDAGIEAAAQAFIDATHCCRDCGKMLTDEVSRAEGRGRVCRSKKA